MKWSETITFDRPLLDVQRVSRDCPDDWREQLRQREQAGYERGKRDGEKALGEQLVHLRAEMMELHRGVLESLRSAVPQVIRETENMLVDLTLESVQKVVASVPVNAEMVQAVVQEALKKVEDTSEVTVQLHPDDLALLRQHQSPLLEASPESGPVRIAGSRDISRGGCLVQTRFGVIDARRETKLDQLRETLAS